MVFKLVMAASKTWRRLNGYEKLPRVIEGVQFTDGIQADETETPRRRPDHAVTPLSAIARGGAGRRALSPGRLGGADQAEHQPVPGGGDAAAGAPAGRSRR